MAEEVDKPENAEAYVRERLGRHEKIMGFGHAVYRDDGSARGGPEADLQVTRRARGRATVVRDLRRARSHDPEQKGLYPNVDLYAAGVYHMLGIPTDLMTPLFALARMAGWTAHVREQYANNRIIRPGSEYVGPGDRTYVPIEERP